MIRNRVILLVEDNPNDVELTLRAFEKSKINNKIFVARDGEQAIHYLFSTGPHADRDPATITAISGPPRLRRLTRALRYR